MKNILRPPRLLPANTRQKHKSKRGRRHVTTSLNVIGWYTAPFNNMRALRFKSQTTNAFFASVNQMFGGSSQLPTTAEHCLSVDLWILVMLLKCAVRKTQSEKSHAFRDAIIYEKAPFSKCFPSTLTRKAQRSTIALVWRAFSKSSWWISLDASPNPTKKDVASNHRLCDRFKNLTPLSRPIKSKTKTSRDSVIHVFQRFISVSCIGASLLDSLDCLLWLVQWFSLVFFSRHWNGNRCKPSSCRSNAKPNQWELYSTLLIDRPQ